MAEPQGPAGVEPKNESILGTPNEDEKRKDVPEPNPADNTTEELREPNLRDDHNGNENSHSTQPEKNEDEDKPKKKK